MHQPPSPSRKRTRVEAVLWHVPGMPIPQPLQAALQKQGIAFAPASSSYQALSKLLARRNRTGRVLLCVEPDRLSDCQAVLEVLARFDPGVSCWSFVQHRSPKLAAMPLPVHHSTLQQQHTPVQSSPTSQSDRPHIVVKPQHHTQTRSKPDLRLTGVARHDPPGTNPEGTEKISDQQASVPLASSSSLLTEEELAMLLTDKKD